MKGTHHAEAPAVVNRQGLRRVDVARLWAVARPAHRCRSKDPWYYSNGAERFRRGCILSTGFMHSHFSTWWCAVSGSAALALCCIRHSGAPDAHAAHLTFQAALEVRDRRSASGVFSSLNWSCNSNDSILGGGGVCDRSSKTRRRSPTSSQIARVWTSLKVQEPGSGISHIPLARSWATATVQSIKSGRCSRGIMNRSSRGILKPG